MRRARPPVVFIARASVRDGLGHLIRTLCVLRELRRHAPVQLLLLGDGSGRHLIDDEGLPWTQCASDAHAARAALGKRAKLVVFDTLEFDRRAGLRSIPTRYGVTNAIRLSRIMHVLTVIAMLVLWRAAGLPPLYLAGVLFVAVLLVYEQSLVSDTDLSQVKKAFDLNGYVGIVYFAATALSLYFG